MGVELALTSHLIVLWREHDDVLDVDAEVDHRTVGLKRAGEDVCWIRRVPAPEVLLHREDCPVVVFEGEDPFAQSLSQLRDAAQGRLDTEDLGQAGKSHEP